MPIEIEFDFFAAPKSLIGNGTVQEIELERTRVEAGRAIATGETYRLKAGLVVACIGYQTSPLADVPFDERAGRFANDEGRILPGLYCVGWARRGPSGTIGTNRPDGFSVVERIAEDVPAAGSGKPGGTGLDALIAQRGLRVTDYADWQKIDEAEMARARAEAPREKFVGVDEMLAAIQGP